MGGLFSGVARVPLTAMLMVCEMTGSYNLLVPSDGGLHHEHGTARPAVDVCMNSKCLDWSTARPIMAIRSPHASGKCKCAT